jgi:hypothetical protein
MKIFPLALLFTTCYPLCFAQHPQPAGQAQSPAPAQSQPTAVSQAAPALTKPSAHLQPALGQAIGALNLEKWKKGSVRDEAATNLNSIQRDLQSTLPPLLAQADAAPETLSKVLPVSRNIDALYDVLLRVVDGARIAANSDQFSQLQSAMSGLDKGRRSLNDELQSAAAAQEKRIGDLQLALKSQPVPVCPVVAPPPPQPPAKKPTPKKKHKPATTPKPAGTTPATTPAPAAKPNS